MSDNGVEKARQIIHDDAKHRAEVFRRLIEMGKQKYNCDIVPVCLGSKMLTNGQCVLSLDIAVVAREHGSKSVSTENA